MSNGNPARGSEKLLAELIKKGAAATHEEVKAAVALPAGTDYKLLRWLIRGIPPIYFEVETTFQLTPQELGQAVNTFAGNAAVRGINILINGIPNPDVAELVVTVAHGEGQQ